MLKHIHFNWKVIKWPE